MEVLKPSRDRGAILPNMTTRLICALSAYAVLALLAAFTLDGVFRNAVWVLLLGLTAKTVIAYKAGW